jgi:putative NADPH-quinone reductase
VETLTASTLSLPPLTTKQDFDSTPPAEVATAQAAIAGANHLVIVFPIWLGGMPAVLKGFFEQVFRPGFLLVDPSKGWLGKRKLSGVSARIVVTMGAPGFVYRWWFGAHGVRSLESAILGLAGIRPVRTTMLGGVEAAGDPKRQRWLAEMRRLGGAAT